MLFKKKAPPERSRRPLQPTPQRSAVFSYYANRSQRPGPVRRSMLSAEVTLTPKRESRRLRVTPTFVLLMVIGVLLVFNLRLTDQAKVLPVETTKGQIFLRKSSVYQTAAQEAFSSWGSRNKVTINTDRIAASLRQQFPELTNVTVSLPFIGTQPVVYIEPATPQLVLATKTNGLYVLDGFGRALITGRQVPNLASLKLPVVTDQSGLQLSIGRVALPQATVSFINQVVYQLKAKQVPISSLALPAGTSELQVRMDGVGYFTKYNLYGNAREETGTYLALRQQLEQQHTVPKEYIDVRVSGRVYYK